MKTPKRTRCEGSLKEHWLDVMPGNLHHGGAHCNWCMKLISVKARSVKYSLEKETFNWLYGILKVHYTYEKV